MAYIINNHFKSLERKYFLFYDLYGFFFSLYSLIVIFVNKLCIKNNIKFKILYNQSCRI